MLVHDPKIGGVNLLVSTSLLFSVGSPGKKLSSSKIFTRSVITNVLPYN